MLASLQLQGADLLDRILDAAAVHARAALGVPVSLRRCENVEIREAMDDLQFESWCLRKDDEGLVVMAMATARDESGHACVVATGRFTFSTFAAPSASIVTRLGRLGASTK
ncbi:hypothetical protein [Sphingomonas sp.]|uniref:hypothetical protein n=1 Tax=Sphingomonas sp. TaxID=28214 RepID=UPI0025FDBBB4|nr:hypothetical protein [Sphingomonas sp.]MBQ8106666.1 hypothetical protein [Afipia sp.]